MTSLERVHNTLNKKPVDHGPVALTLWSETLQRWRDEGYLGRQEDPNEHFDLDVRRGRGTINNIADLDFQEKVLEETEETIMTINGNQATLRKHKLHTSTPEHVDFAVKDRAGWEELIKPHLLKLDRRRLHPEFYRREKELAANNQRFLYWGGIGPFEQMHPMCGHEYMLMGMALDPDWVKDMVMTYVNFTIMHLKVLFAEQGKPDGMFFSEDLGFKGKPFMSPAMYQDIMLPGHKKLFQYAHSLGCKITVHSCGYVEPLVPGLIEAGMDCLQAMEVKAGMDLPKLFRKFGDKISFFGGIDVRALISNDRKRLDEEMDKKILPVINNGGSYILHSDHSEPPDINYDTICYFLERGREMTRNKN